MRRGRYGIKTFHPEVIGYIAEYLVENLQQIGKRKNGLYKITKLLKVVNDAAAELRTRLYYII